MTAEDAAAKLVAIREAWNGYRVLLVGRWHSTTKTIEAAERSAAKLRADIIEWLKL